jgi:hypothetical protein
LASSAASAIIVPFQHALEAKLTARQRASLDRVAPLQSGPSPDEHLERLSDDALRWGQVVFWAQAFASILRTYRRVGSEAVRRELEPYVALAETYLDAVEHLA